MRIEKNYKLYYMMHKGGFDMLCELHGSFATFEEAERELFRKVELANLNDPKPVEGTHNYTILPVYKVV